MSLVRSLNHFSSASSTSIRSGFRNFFIFDPFCSNTLILFVVFPNLLDRKIYDTKFPTNVSFLFALFYLSYHCNCSFYAQNLPFVHNCDPVITLPISYQRSSRKVEDNSTHKFNYRYYCHFSGLEIIPYPTAFPYGNGMVLHFYQQQESSTTKTVHKVIN